MTKEEFMKNALGAQYSENEAGLLDKVAKKNLGAQYTESEMNAMSNPVFPLGTGEPAFLDQFRNPMGAQYTERENNAFGGPAEPRELIKELTQQFYSILGGMQNKKEQERVIQIFQMSDDNGKIDFMKYIVDNPNMATGYAVQDEGNMYTGENTPTKNFSNLGFN